MTQKPDWDAVEKSVVGQLLPFQRRTVDWAFHRLYGDEATDASRRFLVADEVGLGKTLVAKGVVAKALKHLVGKVNRVDVVYICSNKEIAAQNLARLRIDGLPSASFQSQDRLTLLPLLKNAVRGRPAQPALHTSHINFLSLTPSTSLHVKGDVGQALERALICRMVELAELGDISSTRWRNLFANRSDADGFQWLLDHVQQAYTIDSVLLGKFHAALRKRRKLQLELCSLTEAFSKKGELKNRSQEVQDDARRVIVELRALLADVCITALQPDLVILDEFQRFPKLLDSEDEDSQLARKLFEYKDVRLLMLSATPYRLWADEVDDPAGVGHYKEFLRTVRFLQRDDDTKVQKLSSDLSAFNLMLRRTAQGEQGARTALGQCRDGIEEQLSLVMSRTDRVPATQGRDAMVRSRPTKVATAPDDFIAYAGLQRVSGDLQQPDMVEYWRSAPYPLSFLSTYKVRHKLVEALAKPSAALKDAVQIRGLFMPSGGIAAAEIPNARTRDLAQTLIGAGLHRIAWVPPSLPHYQLGGAYSSIGCDARTKRLIFSSWKMVPRAVSSVLDAAFVDALLKEGVRPAGRRHVVAGNDFALGYACRMFAREFAPLSLSQVLDSQGTAPTPAAMQALAERMLLPVLTSLAAQYGDPESALDDDSWYWLGPLLLDLRDAEVSSSEARTAIAEALGFGRVQDHLIAAKLGSWPDDAEERSRRLNLSVGVFSGERQLGKMPGDLGTVLARLAIAGPATCALRSLGPLQVDCQTVSQAICQGAAASIALAVLGYLGNEQMVGQLEHQYPNESAFWRRVLMLCLDGCFSAVMDEYVAVLSHDLPSNKDDGDTIASWLAAPARIVEVLSLKPSVLRPEQVEATRRGFELKSHAVTLRHARPLLEHENGEAVGDGASSMTELRNAFNSPFMPFVLSSTSVGQEGLDFHWYCHAIVHWNVPGTPVDFEQRDGRIHRFRNHAVRRNLAHDWGGTAIKSGLEGGAAQWHDMFSSAAQAMTAGGTDMHGMKPSWIYRRGDSSSAAQPSPEWMKTQQGLTAEIERHVPMMAHSRDCERYEEMTRAIGCYRLVFAQPRQEDLLSHLLSSAAQGTDFAASDLAIDLRPPGLEQATDEAA